MSEDERATGPPGTRSPATMLLVPRVVAALLLCLVVGGLVAAFVPQTVATGGEGPDAWRVRVTPGIFAPGVRLETEDGIRRARGGSDASLASTTAWSTPSGSTVLVGPTPRDAGSVRLTSAERGVGEAVVGRILWRRMHVAVLPDGGGVTQLVAIDPRGRVVEVVDDLPPPDGG